MDDWAIVNYVEGDYENVLTGSRLVLIHSDGGRERGTSSQAEVIRKHVLVRTEGKTYAEMPRQVSKTDDDGQPVLDARGEPVMVSNSA